MPDESNLLLKLQEDMDKLANRMSRIEEDTGSIVMIQGRLLNSFNDLQTSLLKVREALLKMKERLG